MAYPEKVPASAKVGMDSFNFSFSMASKAKESMQVEYDSLTDRIDAIVESEKFFIAGIPVLKSIVNLHPSRSDLKKLAKAADRLADLIERHDTVGTNLDIIKTVTENPHWFVSTFGDFSHEIDNDITSLFKDIEE